MQIRFKGPTNPFHWHLVCMQRPPRDSKPDPNKIIAAAQRAVLSRQTGEGISILEKAVSEAISANTFDASYHPLLIRLVMLYEASGMLKTRRFQPEEKDQVSTLLLQAQIMAEELQAAPADQIPQAVTFRLFKVIPGTTQTGAKVTIPEFLQIVGQLTEIVEAATMTKAVPVTTAPIPTSPPKPTPNPEPVPPKPAPVVEPKPEPIPAAAAPQPAAQPSSPPPLKPEPPFDQGRVDRLAAEMGAVMEREIHRQSVEAEAGGGQKIPPKRSKPPLSAAEIGARKAMVTAYLLRPGNLKKSPTLILVEDSRVYWTIYNKRIFQNGIREARSAAEAAKKQKGEQ